MADHTKIEWTEATWNIITGCSVTSPGCAGCYAMKLAGSRLQHHPSRAGLTMTSKAGPVWNGQVRFNEEWLTQPLRWKRPRMIFVCAHGDLFHESVPDAWIDRVFAVMALAPQHTFQVLTKRSARMREYLSSFKPIHEASARVLTEGGRLFAREAFGPPQPKCVGREGCGAMVLRKDWPLPNVWLGVSVEDQKRADERIPDLLATPAAVRWISAEPLLGPVDLLRVAPRDGLQSDVLSGVEWWIDGTYADEFTQHIDWVVVGGESGSGARPMHPDWARSLRDQCAGAGVPFFFKQWGEWVPQVGAVDGWEIDDDPEISRFDHRDWNGDSFGEPYRPSWDQERDDDTVSRIGKARAGRMLDGVEHNGYPQIGGAA